MKSVSISALLCTALVGVALFISIVPTTPAQAFFDGSDASSVSGGCGGCGGAEGPDGSRGPGREAPPAPRPICTLDATPSTLDNGGSTTLKWATTNAYAVSIASIGNVALDGSKKINNVNASRTYVLTATGRGGSVTCTKKITVRPPKPVSKPVCDISANPSLVEKGGASKLTWTSKNATSATLNKGIGSVVVNGSKNVANINTQTVYTLTVKGPGGTATCKTTIKVKDTPEPKKPYCDIDANPYTVEKGGSTELTWTSKNATSATLNKGIGAVSVNGSKTVSNVTYETTYTLTVKGPGGTATCDTTVRVKEVQEPIQCWIDPVKWEITEGESVLLKWGSSSNSLVSGFIDNGIGEVSSPNYGSQEVSPHQTTKYNYVVTNSYGKKAYCNTLIVVKPRVCDYSGDENEEESYKTTTNTCY